MADFEDEYLDVLQNIEAAISGIYRSHPEMTDYDVDKVLNALVRAYQAEGQQRTFTKPPMSPLAGELYAAVQSMCDWRLGRAELVSNKKKTKTPAPEPITVEELIACLKRARKSVELWNKEGGRQGYLNYIDQFMA